MLVHNIYLKTERYTFFSVLKMYFVNACLRFFYFSQFCTNNAFKHLV